MGLGTRLRELWQIRSWVAACVVFALVGAVWSVAKISVAPPNLQSRALHMATASTQVVVDTPRSTLMDIRQDTYSLESLTNRAVLLGNVMASPPVRQAVASKAHVPFDSLQVLPPLTPEQPRAIAEAGNERHTSDILKLNDQYRISIQANPTVPVLQLIAQAPTAEAAAALANASVDSLREYIDNLASTARTPHAEQIQIEQLGRAHGTVVNGGIEWKVALFAFLITFGAACATVIFLRRVREGWRAEALADKPVLP
jgi:hypothetical protein